MDTEEGRLRPDLIVHLPGDTQIVIDAKVPLHASFAGHERAVRRGISRSHDPAREPGPRSHQRPVQARNTGSSLNPLPNSSFLFVPGESFFSAALEQDRTLIEDAIEKRVVLASPDDADRPAARHRLWMETASWSPKTPSESRNLGKELVRPHSEIRRASFRCRQGPGTREQGLQQRRLVL